MRRLAPILLLVLAPSCKKDSPRQTQLVTQTIPVDVVPLEPAHPQATPLPTEVEKAAPEGRALEMRCPSGTTIGGALPPEGTEAWCEREDGKRHGPVVAFYPMGGKRMQGEYRDGAEYGVWQQYFDGGNLRSEKIYERGRKVGVWTTYFQSGVLESQVVHTSDTEQHHTDYRSDGSRARAGSMRGGERYGVWVEWTTDESFREIEYAQGGKPKSKTQSETGIPECDEYIEKYRACIADHVPEAARVPMERAMDAAIKAWRDAASGPAREHLPTSCKAARDAAETATVAMGCAW